MGTTYVKGWIDTNGAPGYATIPGKGQSIYDESATQNMAIGSRVELSDGRVFRYGYFNTATAISLLTAADVSANNVVETDNKVLAPGSSQTTTDATAGYYHLEVTLASVSANQYAGGYLHICDGTGTGRCYRIKSNTATDDPATDNFRIELFDPLAATLSASTDIAITGNTYSNLIGATAATDPVVVGVTMRGVTVDYYAFVQTWGVATVLADGSTASGDVGDPVQLSDGVTGGFQKQDSYTEQMVGVALFTADNGTYGGVYLQLAP